MKISHNQKMVNSGKTPSAFLVKSLFYLYTTDRLPVNNSFRYTARRVVSEGETHD